MSQQSQQPGIGRSSAWLKLFPTAVLLLMITFVPLVDRLTDPGTFGAFSGLTRAVSSFASLPERAGADGFWIAAMTTNSQMLDAITRMESSLESSSTVIDWLIPRVAQVISGWLASGAENVIDGDNGWLYYRPGVEALTEPGFLDTGSATRATDPIPAILEFRDQLAAHDIELVIMPAPTKATIYPEQLSGRYDGRSAVQSPSFDAFLEKLAAAGVHVFDPAPLLVAEKTRTANSLFLKGDSHWSPDGLEVAVRGLADFLITKELANVAEGDGWVSSSKDITNLGDLCIMLGLPDSHTLAETIRIDQVSSPRDRTLGAEVLLLGDSFASIFGLDPLGWGQGAGMAERLTFVLQRPVDDIVIIGDGAYATRRELSRQQNSDRDRLAGKKVVVWEFAARYIAIGDWKTGIDLPHDKEK